MTNEDIVTLIQATDTKMPLLALLYSQNRGLIRVIARRFAFCEPIEDLEQEAFFGLSDAAEHYDPAEGASFSWYARTVISTHLRRYLNQCGHAMRISEPHERLINAYDRLTVFYESTYHRRPSDGEIAAHLGVSQEVAERIRREANYTFISLSTPAGEDDGLTLQDTIADPADLIEDTIEGIQRDQLAVMLWAEVDKLEERQKTIIKARYKDRRPLADVGKDLGISGQAVLNNERNALARLRNSSTVLKFLDRVSPYRDTGLQAFRYTHTSAPELAVLNSYRRARL